jgi:protein ImuB
MNALSTRRYLSVWLRRLSTDRIERRLPVPADGPRAVVAAIQSAQRIVALNDAAAGLGLKPGMALADARAMYPALPVADADQNADLRLLAAVADWCDRYTPLVGLDPPDGLTLDITGCAHLFGGETALARDLVMRLAQQGLRARSAVADTVGCAWAVARHGDSRAPVDARNAEYSIVPRGGTEAAMLPLPVAALRIAPDVAGGLVTMGLSRMADLAGRPRAPLAARFGEPLLRRLDQTLGRADEPITPRLPLPSAMAEQRFAEPIALEADVLGIIEHLARELGRVLERRGEGARLLQLALFRTDGKVHRLEIGTGAPLRDAARARRLFEDRLTTLGDACDPGFGFDVVRLSALVTECCDPVQTGFAGDDQSEELAHLIDRLGARFGLRRVVRLVAQDTHIPEFAVAAVPAHAVAVVRGVPSPSPRLRGEGRGEGASRYGQTRGYAPSPDRLRCAQAVDLSPQAGRGADCGDRLLPEPDSLSPTRPIRLFERPEPIDAVAAVPDGPPVRFRWRRILHEVAHAEGPERIAMEWWRDETGRALTRDYFRVESRSGVRVWLYREGLYGREVERPRWYLHGLFA